MPTATTRPTKPEKKESKSAQIRAFVKAHRKAKANEIAEKLGCSAALVHQVRTKMRRGRKKLKSASSQRTAQMSHHADSGETSPAELCVTFVRAVGGFAEAKKMLLTAEVFSGLKIR